MGYLDNSSITIDAILTATGKRLLSEGQDKFKITRFAVADDEVDYRLWNPNHNLGTDYYGEQVTDLPMTEANPNGEYGMLSKLFTYIDDVGIVGNPPQVTYTTFIGASVIYIPWDGTSVSFTPNTTVTDNSGTIDITEPAYRVTLYDAIHPEYPFNLNTTYPAGQLTAIDGNHEIAMGGIFTIKSALVWDVANLTPAQRDALNNYQTMMRIEDGRFGSYTNVNIKFMPSRILPPPDPRDDGREIYV